MNIRLNIENCATQQKPKKKIKRTWVEKEKYTRTEAHKDSLQENPKKTKIWQKKNIKTTVT